MANKSASYLLIIVVILVGFFWLLPEPSSNPTAKPSSSTAGELLPADSRHMKVSKNFVIRNVGLYTGERFIESVDVEVAEQIVSKIGVEIKNDMNLKEIDGRGMFLIPGLIDAHTHTWGNALNEALNFGVTTELDMFTMPSFFQPHQKLRDELNNTEQADLYSATILATAPKGHGTEYGFEIPLLENVEQVPEFVMQRVDDGADYIKAVYSSEKSKRKHFPSISLDILKALAAESSRHNKILVVHVDDLISAKESISAGAKGLVHSFMDKEVDDELVRLMKTNNAFIIPTLQVEASISGLKPGSNVLKDAAIEPYLSRQQKAQLKARFNDFGIPSQAYKRAQRSVKILAENGVTILAGSDAPNPGTSHGASLHAELLSLVSSGLSNEQALHAATGALAKSFGISGRGVIKKGAPASMLLLSDNPLKDIKATRKIVAIWKNGVFFERHKADAKVEASVKMKQGIISDFEELESKPKNIKTKVGSGISPTTDKFANGKSEVSFSISTDSNDGNKSLIVSGEIKLGFAFPWSGLAFLPGKDFSQGADLSELESLIIEARDIEGTKSLDVMLFQQGSFQPITKKIPLEKDMKQIKILLSDFNGVDLTIVNNISIVATGNPRRFSFELDNVRFK